MKVEVDASLDTTEMTRLFTANMAGVPVEYIDENPAPTSAAETSLVVRNTVLAVVGSEAEDMVYL
jgi:hypothetical protein